jgi:hypothetical protein
MTIVEAGGSAFGTLDDVVRAYAQWLELKAIKHAAAFAKRLKADREAARAEAASFTLLRSLHLEPFPAEDPATGGADFLCATTPPANSVVVEVSIVRAESIAAKSGLPVAVSIETEARWFSLTTEALRTKAAGKAAQLKDQSGARVLAICLEHDHADILMGSQAVKWLMTGEPKISVPIYPADGDVKETTNLKDSAFFRLAKAGGVEACRRSISAVLLIGVSQNYLRALGLLHPDPAVPLDHTLFYPIPWLAVTNWPLHQGEAIKTEWRMPVMDPEPKVFAYQPPWPTDDELRGH